MKSTPHSIERALDEKYRKLSGKELANMVNSHLWDMIQRDGQKEGAKKVEMELDRLSKEYIRTLPPYEKDAYRVRRYEHDVVRLVELHLKGSFTLLCRQEDLINLLLLQLDIRWMREVVECPVEKKGMPEAIENREMLKSLLKNIRASKTMITIQKEGIINHPLWKNWNITPPELPEDPLASYETFLEQIEKMETGTFQGDTPSS